MTTKRGAVGIVRVSRLKGREGETFASPEQQRERIAAACERDNLKLTHVYGEMDVSGGTPLEKREGLRAAVEAVEAGQVEVICAAYFDRLVRSLKVQHELIERVERAGGQVLAVDIGQVTKGSAGQWLSGALLGAVSEYQRRTTAERSVEAQRRAVARGVAPFPRIPPATNGAQTAFSCPPSRLLPWPRRSGCEPKARPSTRFGSTCDPTGSSAHGTGSTRCSAAARCSARSTSASW